jgi:hypothetical protein
MSKYSSIIWGERIVRIIKYSGFSVYSSKNGQLYRRKIDFFIMFVTLSTAIAICVYSWRKLDFNSSIISIGNQFIAIFVIMIAILSMLQTYFFGRQDFHLFHITNEGDELVISCICSTISHSYS